MEKYHRVRTWDEDEGKSLPFKDLSPHVRVKEGSKIRNLIGYALAHMGSEDTGQIVFSAYGRAVTKAITSVEILKRQVEGLHQVSKVQCKTLQEVWEQKGPEVPSPTPCLTVQKNLPSICILLCKMPLDPREKGYQPPLPSPATDVGMRPCASPDKCCISKWRKIQESMDEGEG